MKPLKLPWKNHGYQIDGSDKGKCERALKKGDLKNEADICLHCHKKECVGSKLCFEKEREHGKT